MPHPLTLRWTVVIPLKALPSAKSRLAPTLSPAEHGDMVRAIRADTLAAVRGATNVARIVVVTDQPGRFDADLVLVQSRPGLNAGLAEAAEAVAARWPDDGVAALVGDLPALRSNDLAEALGLAQAHSTSFVADSSGTGTTMLTALPGVALQPEFGSGSAARHERTAVPLEAQPSLRADVDTVGELDLARQLGVGAHTRAAIAARAGAAPKIGQ